MLDFDPELLVALYLTDFAVGTGDSDGQKFSKRWTDLPANSLAAIFLKVTTSSAEQL